MKTIQIATITGLVAVFALAIAPSLVEDVYATILISLDAQIDMTEADSTALDYLVDADMNLVDATTFEYDLQEVDPIDLISPDFSVPKEFEFQYSYEPVTELTQDGIRTSP